MAETENLSKSGLAIAALVIAIIAALSSIIPIINNLSFFLAIISLVLGIVAMIGISRGKHSGKGIGIASIVLSIIAIVLVLATQSFYGAVLDQAVDGAQVESATTQQSADNANTGASENAEASESADPSNLSVGDEVTLTDGLVVSVDKVETGLVNYDGNDIVAVTVTYTNNGSSTATYSSYDWKAEDKKGAQRSETYYPDAQNELGTGNLSAGGSVNGTICFDAPITKVHYYNSMISSESTAVWNVK